MISNPSSLFDIILNFVSSNVEIIDSLVGFPSITGEAVFKKTVSKQFFSSKDVPIRISIAEKFTEAYRDLILTSLSMKNSLIIINEYLEPLIIFTEFLTELDVSCNHIGDNHEFITHICKLNYLKRLSLKQNDLTDYALRKLSLPVRTFHKGLVNIQELDLSGNFFTDAIVPMLERFPHLIFVDLSGTNLTDKGFSLIEKSNGMRPCSECHYDMKPIETKGWAIELINQWKTFCIKVKNPRRLSTANNFYSREFKMKQMLCNRQQPLSVERRCFVKIPVSIDSTKLTSIKRTQKISSVIDSKTKRFKAIEQELFQQYM